MIEIELVGQVIEWRGPAPYLFLPLSEDDSDLLRSLTHLSYGWGCIAVSATIGDTTFTTSLMPRNDRYLLPVKVAVQRAEGVGEDDVVRARVRVPDAGS